MSKISIKKDFKNGDTLYDVDLNNNFSVIEAGVNANEENLDNVIKDAELRLQKELEDITADRGWDWNGGNRVTFFKGSASEVEEQPIKDGQLLYNTETGETALDDNGKRINTGSGNVVVVSDTQPTNEATKDWIKPVRINGTETAEEYFKNSNNQWKKILNQPSGDTLPIGSIAQFGGATAPTNWLLCNGQAVSRETYSELFAVIGTTYGEGNGSTTFNLPDYNAISPTGVESYINKYSIIKAKQSIGVLADVTRDINDTNDGAVPNAKTVKDYVDNVPNIVLDGDEVKAGFKVNGKDVYAKKFTLGTGPKSGAEKNFDISSKGFSLTNYSIVRYEIKDSNGLIYPIITGNDYSVYAWLNTKTEFKIKAGANNNTTNITFYVTMYYTKTTE